MTSRGAVLAILAIVMLSGAGGAASPVDDASLLVIEDPEGDSGILPCSAAIDLLRFSAAWGEAGVDLEYTFRDLSVVTSPVGMAQDSTGRCFYSYTEFVADFESGTVEGAVYIDHIAFPVYITGWRVYFHGEGVELPATIDGNQIYVNLPYEILGEPTAGDRFGDISLQAVSDPGGFYLPREVDRAPDHGGPCGCWIEFPTS